MKVHALLYYILFKNFQNPKICFAKRLKLTLSWLSYPSGPIKNFGKDLVKILFKRSLLISILGLNYVP